MPSWKRTYWVVFAANLITAVGMMSFLPFFPALLEELGVEGEDARATWSGILFGAAPLAAAFMGPVWGSIGDRFGRKVMVVRALLAITVFVGAMGFATSPWQLLALRLGQGVFSGFIPPSLTLVSVSSPVHLQGRVTGSLQAALPAGMIAGPLIGAALQSSHGMSAVFAFVSCASGVSALLVALFATEEGRLKATLERFSPTSVLSGAWGDLLGVFRGPGLRQAVLVLFCLQFGLGATNPLLALYVEDLWTGAPERVEALTAALFSALAITGMLITPLWAWAGDRFGHRRTLSWSAFGTGLFLAAHAVVPGYAGLFGARLAVGSTAPGTNAAAFGVAATETEAEDRGSAMGAIFSARALAVSLGSIGGGFLAAAIGVRALFVVSGASVIVLLLFSRAIGSRPPAQGS